MVDSVEIANDQLREEHEKRGETDSWPRRMAVAVSVLAASLAIAEIGAKSSQTAYLTHHIAASDDWAAYQAKNLRATVWSAQAELLSGLPNAASPEVQEKIKAARAEVARMRDEPTSGDGMKQLREKALLTEEERDHAFHRYHGYEYTSGGLEISIVLASVSVVTRVHQLGIAAVVLGLVACLGGLAVYAHLF